MNKSDLEHTHDEYDEDVCEWTRRINNFTTLCGEDFVPLMRGYKFCPYCGRRMKVRTKDGE